MNIKSNLRRPFKLFPYLSLHIILFAVITGIGLGITLVGVGNIIFSVVSKTVFILISLFITLLIISDSRDGDEIKKLNYKKYATFIIIALLFCDIGLYFSSGQESEANVKVIITPQRKQVSIQQDNGDYDYKMVDYKRADFYDVDSYEKVDSRDIMDGEDEKLEFTENIIGMKTYVDYFPLLTYGKKIIYIREQ